MVPDIEAYSNSWKKSETMDRKIIWYPQNSWNNTFAMQFNIHLLLDLWRRDWVSTDQEFFNWSIHSQEHHFKFLWIMKEKDISHNIEWIHGWMWMNLQLVHAYWFLIFLYQLIHTNFSGLVQIKQIRTTISQQKHMARFLTSRKWATPSPLVVSISWTKTSREKAPE